MSDEEREEVIATLAALENDGRLTPDLVVEEAADPKSPLHSHFEWDDGEAAHRYRLDQARALIRGVYVTITTEKHTVVIPRYVRDPSLQSGSEQGYMATPALQKQPETVIWRALSGEFGRAEACLQRAESLAEAFGMAKQVTKLRNRLTKIREMAEGKADAA